MWIDIIPTAEEGMWNDMVSTAEVIVWRVLGSVLGKLRCL